MKSYALIILIILGLPSLAVLLGTLELFWFRFLGFSYILLGFVTILFMDELEGQFALKAAGVFFISGVLIMFTVF